MDNSLPFLAALRHFVGEHTRLLTNHLTYTTRSGIAKGLKRTGGFGFLPRETTQEESFYLSRNLAGKIVFDVGSNEGIFSLFAARAIGSYGALVAFEPNPESFRRTLRNVKSNHFACVIVTQNIALGKERGTATMSCPSGETARSTLSRSLIRKFARDGEKCVSFQVRVERLDDLVESGLPAPDFIKIDTEGYELEVLLGARQTLRQYQPELFIELHGSTPEDWKTNRNSIHLLLAEFGYQTFDMNLNEVAESDRASHLYCKNPMNASVLSDDSDAVLATTCV